MEFKIEKMESCRIAYMRTVGPYGIHNIQLMEKLKKWAKDHQLLNKSAVILGIAHDNPEVILPEICRYDVCLIISDDYKLDESINETTLIGGSYAVYQIKHTTEEIQKAWGYIFSDLEKHGYQIVNKPIIERYAQQMIENHYCEICIPIHY